MEENAHRGSQQGHAEIGRKCQIWIILCLSVKSEETRKRTRNSWSLNSKSCVGTKDVWVCIKCEGRRQLTKKIVGGKNLSGIIYALETGVTIYKLTGFHFYEHFQPQLSTGLIHRSTGLTIIHLTELYLVSDSTGVSRPSSFASMGPDGLVCSDWLQQPW